MRNDQDPYLVDCLMLCIQFLTKALTALITAPPKALPAPYLKPNSRKQGVELPRVLLNSWTDLVYHVSELMVPLLADETKVAHVWLLYTAGLDQTAVEVCMSCLVVSGRLPKCPSISLPEAELKETGCGAAMSVAQLLD